MISVSLLVFLLWKDLYPLHLRNLPGKQVKFGHSCPTGYVCFWPNLANEKGKKL